MVLKSVDTRNMSTVDVKSIKDASRLIKTLTQKYSHKEVLEKTGLDKNVLYRLENEQNVTLANFLKIKQAFPDVFNGSSANKGIGKIPIIGQIIDDLKVKPLNPSQRTEFVAPITLVKRFSPVYAYTNVSSTGYNTCVHVFSTADINWTNINKQCLHRLILAFPSDKPDVYFGYVDKNKDMYELKSAKDRQTIHTFSEQNKVEWAKWICMLPVSMMEYAPNSPEHDDYIKYLNEHDKHWEDNASGSIRIFPSPNIDNQ
tara:strand:+ start:159 stop:932 length:774 start_codon:yes stop_codon:yes gene_type:complete